MRKLLILMAVTVVVTGLWANTAARIPERGNSYQNQALNRMTRDIFYSEDFETGASDWNHYDGAVVPNNWAVYPYGGTQGNVWWMGDHDGNGGYYNHQYLVLDTPGIPISTGNTTLTFKMRLGLEAPGGTGEYNGWDSFNLRISTNSGVSWSVLSPSSPAYNFTSSYAFGSEFGEGPGIPGWGGQMDWTPVTVDLSSYLTGGVANVKIRFAFASDPAYSTGDDPALFGAMVDDILLAGYSNPGVDDGQMTWASMVPTAGDYWHLADIGADAPSPVHVFRCQNSAGTYYPFMLDYLESPLITLPAAATQLVADFQIKGNFSDLDYAPEATLDQLDYWGWEISLNNGLSWRAMSNPYADTTMSNYVYVDAPGTWASMINSYTLNGDISNLAGQTVKFRWYFKSDGDTPIGSGIMIDNFQIFSVSAAPAPVNLVYPTNNEEGISYAGFFFDWSPSSQGAAPEYYVLYVDDFEENLELDFFAPTYLSNEIDATVATYVHSTNIPDFTMAAGQTWYWRVAAYVTGQTEAWSDIYRFDTVEAAAVISEFPWTEDFEGAAFPPDGWSIGNLDNDTTTWALRGNISHSPTHSAYHIYSDVTPDPGQNGWLITPPIEIPATGASALSFWSLNNSPSYTVYNAVLVNTDSDPLDPYWEELWVQEDFSTATWVQKNLDISSLAGELVYFAFKYTGYDANAWFVDDVSVTYYESDVLGPILSNHLPVLNTLRDDISFPVSVDVVDDAIFNSGVGGVNLYHSVDAGTTWSVAIPMFTADGITFTGELPAAFQVGDTVTYKFSAYDTLNNFTEKSYSFEIDDPVMMYYDHTGPTSFNGSTAILWGPMVYFENPLYGTGNALKLLSTMGIPYTATDATLYVYGEDFEGNVSNLITPMTINFPTGQAWTSFDLSAYDIQITTPYFWIVFGDMTTSDYYGLDATYDYTPYAFIMYNGTPFYNFTGLAGEWCIDVVVQTGDPHIYFGPEVNITQNMNGNPLLSWDAIPTATTYEIYAADDPYGDYSYLTSIGGTSYEYTGSENMKFFQVSADNAPPRNAVLHVRRPAGSLDARKLKVLPSEGQRK